MFNIPIHEQGLGLFVQLMKELVRSEVGGKVTLLFASLIVMLLGVNGLNIVNSFVGRDFMTAIAERDTPKYLLQAGLWVGVFALSTIFAVFLRFAEEKLGLLCRDWMTRSFTDLYLQYPVYYRMNDAMLKTSGIEHPDQRIADDVKVFAVTTLSFTLMVMNGVFTVIAFSGVLWAISPMLFAVALVYAALGSYITVLLGQRLVELNYDQLDKEAAFRSGLMQVREKAESVALLHRETRLLNRLHTKFDAVVGNFGKIIVVNRNLGFFTTGYNYLVQVIPVLLAAPLFVDKNADFGVITQAAMAFATLIGAFSLIVTQFQSISSFAAVIQRLINLWYAIELAQSATVSGIDVTEDESRLAYEKLTLFAPSDGQFMVKDLNLEVRLDSRVLITVRDEAIADLILKATAGIADVGTGRVIRPPLKQLLFLPERPFVPPGSLREALACGSDADAEAIGEALRTVGLEQLPGRAGGLDTEQDWEKLASVHEQQGISFARILLARPRVAMIDLRAIDPQSERAGALLDALSKYGIGLIAIGTESRATRLAPDAFDAWLRINPHGEWDWSADGG